MEAFWDRGYIFTTKEPAETAIALGWKILPPMTLKELLGTNKEEYVKYFGEFESFINIKITGSIYQVICFL